MNKKNKILVGCLALLLALSIGYALFSETITINGTATAKGNFDINFVCTSTTPTGSARGNCSISGQTITTTSTLTKPSEGVTYIVTLTNKGTIPALLKTVNSSNNRNSWRSTTAGDVVYYDYTNKIGADYWINDSYCGDSEVENAKVILNQNETMKVEINHMWDNISNQPSISSTGVTFDYDIELGFEQYTN